MKCFEFKILYSSFEGHQPSCNPSPVERRPYLPGSVYNFSRVVLAIVLDDPAEGIFNCGVVAFDEMVLNKADCERRFACGTNNSALDNCKDNCKGKKKQFEHRSGVILTDGAAADNCDLSLLRRGRHVDGANSTAQMKRIGGKSKTIDRPF